MSFENNYINVTNWWWLESLFLANITLLWFGTCVLTYKLVLMINLWKIFVFFHSDQKHVENLEHRSRCLPTSGRHGEISVQGITRTEHNTHIHLRCTAYHHSAVFEIASGTNPYVSAKLPVIIKFAHYTTSCTRMQRGETLSRSYSQLGEIFMNQRSFYVIRRVRCLRMLPEHTIQL